MCYILLTVPRIILQEKYDSIPEEDEPLQVDYDIEVGFDLEEGMFPEGDIYSESPNMAVAGRRLNNSNTYVAPTKTSPIQHHTYDGGFHGEQCMLCIQMFNKPFKESR